MKRFMLIVTIGLLSTSCSNKFVRIYETKTVSNMKLDDGYYHFENDTLSIHYSFWANKGVISYTIFNKLDIPVYLDWKKSSFVKNNLKFDYWQDEVNSTSNSYYRGNIVSGVYYTGLDLRAVTIEKQRHISSAETTTTKPERITFLAPRSQIFKAEFYIYLNNLQEMEGYKPGSISDPSAPRKKIDIQTVSFNSKNTPVFFRNFVTFSTTEKFEKESYIDNGFYVSKIIQMKKKPFMGKAYTDPFEGYKYKFPFKNSLYYYVVF